MSSYCCVVLRRQQLLNIGSTESSAWRAVHSRSWLLLPVHSSIKPLRVLLQVGQHQRSFSFCFRRWEKQSRYLSRYEILKNGYTSPAKAKKKWILCLLGWAGIWVLCLQLISHSLAVSIKSTLQAAEHISSTQLCFELYNCIINSLVPSWRVYNLRPPSCKHTHALFY